MAKTNINDPASEPPADAVPTKMTAADNDSIESQGQMDSNDSDELPLPQQGDYLFERRKFSFGQVGAQPNEIYRFPDIRDGYKLAGDALVDHWLCTREDRLLFPILYCYRHAVELSMKLLLWLWEWYRPGNPEEIFRTHDLKKLWEKCRLILRECGVDSDETVCAAESLILELHEMDERSFNFRYAHDNKGVALNIEEQGYDLMRIRDCIGKLYEFFETSEGIIGVELDARSDGLEIELEHRGWLTSE